MQIIKIIAEDELTNCSALMEQAAWLLIAQRMSLRSEFRSLISNQLDGESN
jgi:hypothetical protein